MPIHIAKQIFEDAVAGEVVWGAAVEQTVCVQVEHTLALCFGYRSSLFICVCAYFIIANFVHVALGMRSPQLKFLQYSKLFSATFSPIIYIKLGPRRIQNSNK